MWKEFLTKFLRDESGQDIVEYSLLLTLIGATSLSVLTMVGINIGHIFDKTLSTVQYIDDHIDKAPGN
jgi:Flp pilus assembly pilin Flp